MSHFRNLGLPVLVGLVLALAGAVGQQPGTPGTPRANRPAAPPALPAAPTADREATNTLANAIAKLSPKRVSWVQADLWQQSNLQGLVFQADGSYLSAPDNRLRVELGVRVAGTTGRLTVVSDGKMFWEGVQLGKDPIRAKRYDLKQVLDALNSAPSAEQLRQEFLQSQSFAGVVPLLRNIQSRMVLTRQEKVAWGGHACLRLTAAWAPEQLKRMSPADVREWPAFFPRQCRLYIDADSGWPHRVEWWGPVPPQTADGVLIEIEFRNPRLNRPLPAEQVARAFTFDAGTEQPKDQTAEITDAVRQRIAQDAATRRPR